MTKEKTPGELRTDQLFKRLRETAEGAALASVIDTAGGRSALAKALDLKLTDIDNWCSRGKVSKRGAEIIGESKHFPQSKQDMLPNMKEFQWLDGRK